MKNIDKETSFGDQGHLFTAPRRLSCPSSSTYHLFCKEAPVGGVATNFGTHATIYCSCFWFEQGQE
jgi:hypothetical protein